MTSDPGGTYSEVNEFSRQLHKARYPTEKSKPYVRFTSLVVLSHPWSIVVKVAVRVTMPIYIHESESCYMIILQRRRTVFEKVFENGSGTTISLLGDDAFNSTLKSKWASKLSKVAATQ